MINSKVKLLLTSEFFNELEIATGKEKSILLSMKVWQIVSLGEEGVVSANTHMITVGDILGYCGAGIRWGGICQNLSKEGLLIYNRREGLLCVPDKFKKYVVMG